MTLFQTRKKCQWIFLFWKIAVSVTWLPRQDLNPYTRLLCGTQALSQSCSLRFTITGNRGRDEGRNRTADTCLDDWNEIAAEITNMICVFISLLYHLSYLAMWHVLLICKDVCAIALMERVGLEPTLYLRPSVCLLFASQKWYVFTIQIASTSSATSPYSVLIRKSVSVAWEGIEPPSLRYHRKRIIAVRVTWSMTTAHNVLSIELPRKIAETGFEPVTSGAWTRQATTAPLRHDVTSPLGYLVSSAMSFLAFLT